MLCWNKAWQDDDLILEGLCFVLPLLIRNITLLRLNHHLAKLYSNRASLQKVRSNAMQELSTIHQPMDSAQFFLEIVAEFQLRLAKYDIDHEKD